jgi:hypothetical protein
LIIYGLYQETPKRDDLVGERKLFGKHGQNINYEFKNANKEYLKEA